MLYEGKGVWFYGIQSKSESKSYGRLAASGKQKAGDSCFQLRQDLEAGKFDSAMKNMSQKDAAKFQQVVNNPKIVEKLMNAPQAKALYEKLTGEKK